MFVQSAEVTDTACDCCRAVRKFVQVFVGDEDATRAAVLAYCYPPHTDEPSEIWIDAVLGTWGIGDGDDHVTFGCRYGTVDGQLDDACSLTDAAQFSDANPILGQRLTREQALNHPLLSEFWSIVDLVLTTVPAIVDHRASFHGFA